MLNATRPQLRSESFVMRLFQGSRFKVIFIVPRGEICFAARVHIKTIQKDNITTTSTPLNH
uniref:Uncharacterized protein n=1 Tax=Anguilla anguilla TaxID=7936 RepID=A0A0E9QMJ7_ANGAN